MEIFWTAKSFQDEPYSSPAHCAKCLGDVDKSNIETLASVLCTSPGVVEDKHRVNCASIFSEATLAHENVISVMADMSQLSRTLASLLPVMESRMIFR